MAGQIRNRVAYGLSEPLPVVSPAPIVAKRAPTTSDFAPIGQLWVEPVNSSGVAQNLAWILTSIISNSATWIQLESSGGPGVFSSLVVNPGPTSLSTVGNGAVTIGNSANTQAITLVAGVGNLAINGAGHIISIANDAAANSLILGSLTNGATTLIEGGNGTGVGSAAITFNTATTGDIQIGSVAHTGAIYLGVSTAGDTINIGNAINTGAQVINIASGASAANSTVNIMSGTATAGTQTLNLASGAFAHAINIGTGAAVVNTIAIGGTGANVITIGNTQTAGSISLGANMVSGTINIGSANSGLVAVPPHVSAPVASPTATVTNNARVGYVSFTGFTTAAGGVQTFTISNSTITAASAILASAINFGTNAALMTVVRILPSANSVDITLENSGVAALNGDVAITFWILS